MLDVHAWAELRREHFVRGVCIKELARRTGLSRNTIRAALRSSAPPKYSRPAAPSKLDPFKGGSIAPGCRSASRDARTSV